MSIETGKVRGVKRVHWRLLSIGYLLLALLLFLASTWVSHRHGVWAPWVVLAIVFLVLGARTGPPHPKDSQRTD